MHVYKKCVSIDCSVFVEKWEKIYMMKKRLSDMRVRD